MRAELREHPQAKRLAIPAQSRGLIGPPRAVADRAAVRALEPEPGCFTQRQLGRSPEFPSVRLTERVGTPCLRVGLPGEGAADLAALAGQVNRRLPSSATVAAPCLAGAAAL